MMECIARAKINLALHVTGQREDGFHLLDSLVVFAEAGDKLLVDLPHHAHGPITLSVEGPFGDALDTGPGNLVATAAIMLRNAAMARDVTPAPVDIHLVKNLPVASGIGGGSADAAATLLALKDAWELDIDLMPIALSLGADVPMCLQSRPLRARGIGDELEVLNTLPAMELVLVNPGKSVSTPDIFKALHTKDNPEMAFDPESDRITVETLGSLRNDLQETAIHFVPEIADCLDMLEKNGAQLFRMSGSGATCFGVFPDAASADRAQKSIARQKPEWWCIATRACEA